MNKLKNKFSSLLKGAKEHWLFLVILLCWGALAFTVTSAIRISVVNTENSIRTREYNKGYNAAIQDILYGLKDKKEGNYDADSLISSFPNHSELQSIKP